MNDDLISTKLREMAEMEERECTCGAGHGSGEVHMNWCEWADNRNQQAQHTRRR